MKFTPSAGVALRALITTDDDENNGSFRLPSGSVSTTFE
jgi:hypothetical protein